jgi:hypothetical protein
MKHVSTGHVLKGVRGIQLQNSGVQGAQVKKLKVLKIRAAGESS